MSTVPGVGEGVALSDSSPKFVVATGQESRPISGFDTMIAIPPAGIYGSGLSRDGEKVVRAGALAIMLRQLSNQGAAGVGEDLHHADWVLTSDPDRVRAIGLMHDCVTCRAQVDQALAHLRESPNVELLVGVLYWAGR